MSTPRPRRHHQLLRAAWVSLDKWAERNRTAIRQALADTMSPLERRQFDRQAVRIQARRAVAFLN